MAGFFKFIGSFLTLLYIFYLIAMAVVIVGVSVFLLARLVIGLV